ncbi:MAG: hypothetical protein DHS20C12_05180 [Pseudohongiella sp.]|nr:MAG: hypothetical protein DHS20C12_05180 [Pseudohongiella sp.]
MNMMEIEAAARTAWPALEEYELPFGVLRYSRGTDRRSNSLSLHPHAEVEVGKLVGVLEEFFGNRRAAPIVRIVQGQGVTLEALRDIDTALEERGYERQAPTLSMLLDLTSAPLVLQQAGTAVGESIDIGSWLPAWYALTDRQLEKLAVHRELLQKSVLPQRCLLSRSGDGCLISSGMAVFAKQTIGIFGIATAPDYRNQGHALKIVQSLLKWGMANAAKYAYLQVEESNHAAISLYEKLGFETAYSYWYRVGRHQGNRNED